MSVNESVGEGECNSKNYPSIPHQDLLDGRTIRFGVMEQTRMSLDDWRRRWDNDPNKSHAGRWQLEVVHPFLIKHAYRFRSVDAKHILVPLSGKSIDLVWLVQQGYKVTAIEGSNRAIYDFLESYVLSYMSERISPTCVRYSTFDNQLIIFQMNVFSDELRPELIGGLVDAVWDRAAVTALHPDDHSRYLAKLEALSKRQALMLFSVYWHEKGPTWGPPFPIDQHVFDSLSEKVEMIDDKDAMHDGWTQAGYETMRERCFQVELSSFNGKTGDSQFEEK
ncbi:unnamed protein product [Rotaria sp. Silwood1]|nr:unnamed protein product [Rotaria sp. Silwood1]CAF3921396.1 unnamed protein product [Rotaria sp. Silwood1]CAF4922898.1 unnamed protein product [Rotaria sp. Silwood1]CAF4978036.1 unnamed protein product [Rotaria sp. Silwood1]